MHPYYLHPTGKVDGQFADCFGIFVSLTRQTALDDIARFPICGLDNGRFTNKWTEKKWRGFLARYQPLLHMCAFAVVPDVPFDAEGTLKEFVKYAPVLREIGYPVALATQDGMTPSMVPWDEIDVVFVGGTDEHKRGAEGGVLIAEAKRRGKRVHVGRVNSGSTLLNYFWMADSWDGTTFLRHPTQQYVSIGRAVRQARQMQEAKLI